MIITETSLLSASVSSLKATMYQVVTVTLHTLDRRTYNCTALSQYDSQMAQ